MRASTRIGSVVLAGTLLCSIGFGSLALADAPAAPISPAIVVVPEAANGASFTTAHLGGIQFQVGTDWVDTTASGATGEVSYACDYGIVTAYVIAADARDDVDEMTQTILGEIDDGSIPNLAVGDAQDRYLDGSLVRTIAFSDSNEAITGIGFITLVFGSNETAVVMAMYAPDEAGVADYLFDQLNRSISFATYITATDGDPMDTGVVSVTTKPATTEGGATPASAVNGSFELPGWTVAADTSAASLVHQTIAQDFWDSEIAGKQVVGIPVTVTNAGDEAAQPWWGITVTCYGPDGLEQTTSVGWAFDDAFTNLPSMRPGATASGVVYLEDQGAGTYVVEFSAWDKNFNTVKHEVEFTL